MSNMGVRFTTKSGSEYVFENGLLSGGTTYHGPARIDVLEAGKPALIETLFGPMRTSTVKTVSYYGL